MTRVKALGGLDLEVLKEAIKANTAALCREGRVGQRRLREGVAGARACVQPWEPLPGCTLCLTHPQVSVLQDGRTLSIWATTASHA